MKNKGLTNLLRARIALFLLLACLFSASAKTGLAEEKNLPPDSLSYAELTTLYEQETIPPLLGDKLNRLLTIPFVNNQFRPANPLSLSNSQQLGEFLRVAHWNIERGLEYEAIEAIFSSEERLATMLDEKEFPQGSEKRLKVLEQAALLRTADVIILNEVDWGLKRTNYRNIAADLAARLGMNYAFGVQFVELSPVQLTRDSTDIIAAALLPPEEDAAVIANEFLKLAAVDPERYKGLHGVAILSRLPLENVRLIPFKHQPYDWYRNEKKNRSMLEKGKRKLSEQVFLEKSLREVRRGGRTMLLADIVDERLPSGRVTVVATHLENRTKPTGRITQLKELLGAIREIRHPVIVGGDMNTSPGDLTPTNVKRELKKRFGTPKAWMKRGINYALGIGFIEDIFISAASFLRKYADPTVCHIPFFSPNPGKKFFSLLKEFRFADGGAFDFRGDPSRSAKNKDGTLANSNQRGGKGFVTTYQFKRPLKFVGKFKLDWIFVKPAALTNPTDTQQSYRFAPHFGQTLSGIRSIVDDRVSDHHPLVIDLPLAEPTIEKERKQ